MVREGQMEGKDKLLEYAVFLEESFLFSQTESFIQRLLRFSTECSFFIA